MTLPGEDDDAFLESTTDFQCKSCSTELVRCDHSPFENGYYFYCSDCIVRVDISIYDREFEEIENQLQTENSISKDAENYLDHLFPRIESRLAPCKCGGSFKSDAPRRCLNCSDVLPEVPVHQNVWHQGWGTDECIGLHSDIVRDAAWTPYTSIENVTKPQAK